MRMRSAAPHPESPGGLALASSSARAGHLAALGAAAALCAALATAMWGALALAADEAVRQASAAPSAVLAVELQGSADGGALADAVDAAFPGVPMLVERTGAGWSVRPDDAAVGARHLPALAPGAEVLAEADGISSVEGGTGWALRVTDAVEAARSAGLTALAIVVAVAVVAFRELARLLAGVRRSEDVLLLSRGSSARRLVARTALEALLVATPAAALGAAAGSLVAPDVAAAFAAAGATAVLAVLVTGATTASALRGAAGAERTALGERTTRALGASAVLVVVAIAAVALWQARIASASTATATNPFAVAAPALVLLSGALAVLVVSVAVARGVERTSARGRGLGRALAARQVARRVPAFATVVLLAALASGSAVVAAGYAAAREGAGAAARELLVGADARLPVVGGAVPAAPVGSEAAAAGLTVPVELGEDEALLQILDSGTAAGVLSDGGGAADPAALTAAIESELPAPGIPDGSRTLVVEGGITPGVELLLWVLDGTGTLSDLPVVDGRAELPSPAQDARLLAIDLDVSAAETPQVEVAIDAIVPEGSGEIDLSSEWVPQFDAFPDLDGQVVVSGAKPSLELERTSRDDVSVRLMPALAEEDLPLPVVLTSGLAERNGLRVGDPASLRFSGSGRTVEGVVSRLTSVIPGAGLQEAASADLAGFADRQLRTAEDVPRPDVLWVDAADTQALTALAEREPAAETTLPDPSDRALSAVPAALTIGVVGTVLLTAIALAAVASALASARAGEVAALRAVGVRASGQAVARASELGAAVLAGMVGGVLVGFVVRALTVGALVRATAPGAPAGSGEGVGVDPGLVLWLLGALAAAAAAVIGLAAARVRAAAATAVPGEGARVS